MVDIKEDAFFIENLKNHKGSINSLKFHFLSNIGYHFEI